MNDEEILIYWPQTLEANEWGHKAWTSMEQPKGTIYMDKEGKYINLYKPEEDKKYYRYNLADKSFYRINIYKTTGTKETKVKPENLRSWFYENKIVTTNPLFARVFLYNKSDGNLSSYKNPVRYIEAFNRLGAQALEEWYNMGVKFKEIEDMFNRAVKDDKAYTGRYYRHRIRYRPSEFSKEVLRVIKSLQEVSCEILDEFYSFSDADMLNYQKLFSKSKRPEFNEAFLFEIRGIEYNIFHSSSWDVRMMRERLLGVIKEFNIDIDAFCRFLSRLKRVEGCDLYDLMDGFHYRDYLRMEKELNNNNVSKIDKYPKNWLTSFRRTKRNYDDIQKRVDREKFKVEVEKQRDLEFEDKKYSMILPEEPGDIRQEGATLKHCVASYVNRVTNGQTCIIFCRENTDIKEPFVTVEVKNANITQAYGFKDSKPDKKTLKFLVKWAKEKKLLLSWAWEKDFTNRRGE